MIFSASSGVAGAPHVVLIHGALDRSAGLLKLSRRLDHEFRVTRYDRRGYGRSRTHEGPYDMDGQVSDLAAVIGAVTDVHRPCVLIGHSYGGNVALALAARQPELVDAVVTYETPLSWRRWWPGESAGSDALAWRNDPAEAAERFMRRLIGDEKWARLPQATRDGRRAEGAAMVDELTDLRARPPWDPKSIRQPVLAMHGEFGQRHHRDAAEAIAAEVTDGRCVSLSGASHPGPNTHPDATAAIVIDFIRGQVTSP